MYVYMCVLHVHEMNFVKYIVLASYIKSKIIRIKHKYAAKNT